mgnify:CR=1 FL=1
MLFPTPIGRVTTKWLDFGGGGERGSSWVEYRIPLDQPVSLMGGCLPAFLAPKCSLKVRGGCMYGVSESVSGPGLRHGRPCMSAPPCWLMRLLMGACCLPYMHVHTYTHIHKRMDYLSLCFPTQAVVLTGYELVSANDCPERDPAAWRLEGVSQADFEAGA